MANLQQDLLVKLLLEYRRYKAGKSTIENLLETHEKALQKFQEYMLNNTAIQETLDDVLAIHVQITGPGGVVSGYCAECEYHWPCDTYHRAKGYGPIYQCDEAKWCKHEEIPL